MCAYENQTKPSTVFFSGILVVLATVLIFLMMSSCVTPGDTQRASDAHALAAASAQQAEADFNAGLISAEERLARQSAALAELKAALEEIGDDIDQRTRDSLTGIVGGLSGTELTSQAIMALLAGVGVNLFRNQKRRKRGEPVK